MFLFLRNPASRRVPTRLHRNGNEGTKNFLTSRLLDHISLDSFRSSSDTGRQISVGDQSIWHRGRLVLMTIVAWSLARVRYADFCVEFGVFGRIVIYETFMSMWFDWNNFYPILDWHVNISLRRVSSNNCIYTLYYINNNRYYILYGSRRESQQAIIKNLSIVTCAMLINT